MSRRRRGGGVLAVAGVLLTGAAVVAGSAALAAAVSATSAGATAVQSLPTTPATPSLACPGPETLLAPDGGRPADPGAPVLLTALTGSGRGPATATLTLGGPSNARARELARSAARRGRTLTVGTDSPGLALGTLAGTRLGPAVLAVTGSGSGSAADPLADPLADLAGGQSTLARSGDLRGLAATPCVAPAADSWLVGGGTGDGERLRLLLANPAVTPALVDVTVHGPDGPVPAPAGQGVVVPAGGEVPIYIDALAPGLPRVAVHVTARTGRVVATLHDARLVGLAAAGVDDVTAGAAPARQQVVPGVSLVNGFGAEADDPDAPGSTSVRIAVPGPVEAVVRVRLLDSSGDVGLPRAAVITVPGGGVVDVPVAGVPSGTYTAVVDADVPVVAGARVGRTGPAGTQAAEFAWAAAPDRLAGPGYAVLPPGARATLSLVATRGLGGLVVTEIAADGTLGNPVDVQVPDGSSATVQLSATAAAVRISGLTGKPVAGSIVAIAQDSRGTLISVLPLDLPARARLPSSAVQDQVLGLR